MTIVDFTLSIRSLGADIIPQPLNRGRSDISTEKKVKGPASYFPSIENKYGFPVQHWLDLIATQSDLKHMEMVAWLKNEHGIGHGHANALVAYFRNQSDA